MSTPTRLAGLVLLVAMAPVAVVLAQAQRAARPLTEDRIARSVDELKDQGRGRRLELEFGVQVVGFGVKPDERQPRGVDTPGESRQP